MFGELFQGTYDAIISEQLLKGTEARLDGHVILYTICMKIKTFPLRRFVTNEYSTP
jgi:hypothetical protein